MNEQNIHLYLRLTVGTLLMGAAVYLLVRGPGGVAQDATRTAVNVAGGVATGVIHGVSDVVGVPVPERSKCDLAKAEGRTWDASFDCPAGEFVGYLFK